MSHSTPLERIQKLKAWIEHERPNNCLDALHSLNEIAKAIPSEKRLRVLINTDPYCPSCGHNRDTSSISSVDNEDGTFYCQKCSAEWREIL